MPMPGRARPTSRLREVTGTLVLCGQWRILVADGGGGQFTAAPRGDGHDGLGSRRPSPSFIRYWLVVSKDRGSAGGGGGNGAVHVVAGREDAISLRQLRPDAMVCSAIGKRGRRVGDGEGWHRPRERSHWKREGGGRLCYRRGRPKGILLDNIVGGGSNPLGGPQPCRGMTPSRARYRHGERVIWAWVRREWVWRRMRGSRKAWLVLSGAREAVVVVRSDSAGNASRVGVVRSTLWEDGDGVGRRWRARHRSVWRIRAKIVRGGIGSDACSPCQASGPRPRSPHQEGTAPSLSTCYRQWKNFIISLFDDTANHQSLLPEKLQFYLTFLSRVCYNETSSKIDDDGTSCKNSLANASIPLISLHSL